MQIVIFGLKDLAELAKFYFEWDPNYSQDCAVVAFTANKEFLTSEVVAEAKTRLQTDSIVPFEELEQHYPPDKYYLFAPMTATKMNKNREKIYLEGKKKGYKFASYISSKATVLTNKIGENCFILEDNTIQPFVTIGDNVVSWSGCHFGHSSKIDSHVFMTSHVVVSGHCNIKNYCFFGVNSTLRDGLTLAEGTLVGMGATITKNTDPWSVYVGTPATKITKSSLEIM